MRALVLGALLMFALGCEPAKPGTEYDGTSVYVWHDDARDVTCWIYAYGYKGGISCIPDKELR